MTKVEAHLMDGIHRVTTLDVVLEGYHINDKKQSAKNDSMTKVEAHIMDGIHRVTTLDVVLEGYPSMTTVG